MALKQDFGGDVDMMKTFLIQSFDSDEHWTGTLGYFRDYGAFQQLSISARGSFLDILTGQCDSYRWVFLPDLEVGCRQAAADDLFWNVEILAPHIGPADASSVACAIRFILEQSNHG